MRLIEFDIQEPLVAKIVTATDQLKSDIEKDNLDFEWDVDTLLKYFQKYDINLDREDLYSMIKVPPLKNVIKNIQGDKVVFVGQENQTAPASSTGSSEDSKKVVSQMAKKAMK
jgi:UDP-N-acetylmuramate-alanine ligase